MSPRTLRLISSVYEPLSFLAFEPIWYTGMSADERGKKLTTEPSRSRWPRKTPVGFYSGLPGAAGGGEGPGRTRYGRVGGVQRVRALPKMPRRVFHTGEPSPDALGPSGPPPGPEAGRATLTAAKPLKLLRLPPCPRRGTVGKVLAGPDTYKTREYVLAVYFEETLSLKTCAMA